jgi:hypothetical protein
VIEAVGSLTLVDVVRIIFGSIAVHQKAVLPLTFTFQTTESFSVGEVVPIPTFQLAAILIRSPTEFVPLGVV